MIYKKPLHFLQTCTAITWLALGATSLQSLENEEKTKDAFVKIFNASYPKNVEIWETGLNLKFHDAPLASDVRIGEGGLVRKITYNQKDTVDVYRNQEHLKNPHPHSPQRPAAKLAADFEQGSMTLIVVHGNLDARKENLSIETIKEFPVPVESRRPGMARLFLANFRQGDPVFLLIGETDPLELPYNEKREIFVPPGETEIFLIHKEEGKIDFKRQLAAFKFQAEHNYTGIISPAAEIPSRPSLRISDSNQDWSNIRTPSQE
jgi:hypothetical protein